MTNLNLTASNKPQELILAYLRENASEVLAEKINSGTPLEKDGKQLLNKKTLDGFMKYASDEARKLAEKGATSACVEDSVVYGWAIHYFEEESIEGKLFNPDGTEYTPPKPVAKTKPVTPAKVEPPKPKQQQASLWDMLTQADNKTDTAQADKCENVTMDNEEEITEQTDGIEVTELASNDPTVDEIADALEQAVAEKKKQSQKTLSPLYSRYIAVQEQYPEHIVLIRLGDFYEAFDKDAKILSDEMNLTLTGRNVGLADRAPMVGFPYHASDAYIAKIREKHSIAVIENENVTALSRTVKNNGKTVDTDTGEVLDVEELSESEMRAFDGDITEPKDMDDSKSTENVEQPSFSPSSFDEDTAIYLLKLLNGKMDLA